MAKLENEEIDECIALIVDLFNEKSIPPSIGVSSLFTLGVRMLIVAKYPIEYLIAQMRKDYYDHVKLDEVSE